MSLSQNYVNHLKLLKNSNNKNSLKPNLKYSLTFVSLISPGTVSTIRLIFRVNKVGDKNRKLLVKQSYMLLTWLFYLNKNSLLSDSNKVPSFFIFPLIKSRFTLLKSPMAHKTFSQEQYMFSYYKLTISFNFLNKNFNSLDSINKSLLFALILRKSFFNFETNFFFLQKIRFNLTTSDKFYFKVY